MHQELKKMTYLVASNGEIKQKTTKNLPTVSKFIGLLLYEAKENIPSLYYKKECAT
jgi:hypothetical protein